jgi:hypothetical protein
MRWCELLDPWARAAALEGVGHCVAQLPAPEVAWHAEFLLHRLRQVLVFREEVVLAALLPALFGAWEVLSPGFDPTAHAALASSLLDDLQRELVYVSDKPAARRSYFRALPALLPLLGLRLCTHLGQLGLGLGYGSGRVRVRVSLVVTPPNRDPNANPNPNNNQGGY